MCGGPIDGIDDDTNLPGLSPRVRGNRISKQYLSDMEGDRPGQTYYFMLISQVPPHTRG